MLEKLQQETKNFKDWLKLKEKLHYLGHPMDIRNGDIWWCATGENMFQIQI